jgi:hypothetical protein
MLTEMKDDASDQLIISADNRNLIKSEVVALVAMVPPILQLPLGDTIGMIADTDFYQNWLNLVPVSSFLFDIGVDGRILSPGLIQMIW